MAVTLNQSITNWGFNKPLAPKMGDCYVDLMKHESYIWSGSSWNRISEDRLVAQAAILVPTQAQLDNFPTLNHAWEEYLVVRKLLGI